MGQSSTTEEDNLLPLTVSEKNNLERKANVSKLINGIVRDSSYQAANEINSQFKHVPLIRNQYAVLGVLGSGAFGNVLKIKELKTKKLFALKSISLSMGRDSGNSDQEMRKHVIRSAETELEVLPRLSHPNIVRYETSFLHNKNPLAYSGGSTHLCLLMEYVHGSDLDTVLTHAEEKKLEIPRAVTILWFVKLMETLKYIHDRGIVHRDLKPDNILLHYSDVNDVHSMNLKISDFGVSKDIEREGMGKEISGHVFFCAPEVLRKQEYDSKIDIWSIAIIFLQVYYGISLRTYQEIVEKLIFEVKETEEMADDFIRMFGKEDMYDGVTYVEVLDFLHTRGLFYQHVFEKFLKEDDGISSLLKTMICNVEDRSYAKDIVETSIFKTWKYILITLSEKSENIDEVEISEFLDIRAVLTITGIINDESELFQKCLDCLRILVEKDSSNVEYLISRKVYSKLTHKVVLFSNNESIMISFFHFMLTSIMKNSEICLQQISFLLRKHYLIDVLRRLVLNLKDTKLYFLTLLLIRENITIRVLFKDSVLSLFLKYMNSSDDSEILFHLLKTLIPLVDTKNDLLKIFSIYKFDNVLFFRRNIAFGDDRELLQKLFTRIMNRIKFFVLRPLDVNFKEEVLDNILMLLFIVGEAPEKKHQIQISIDYEHAWISENSLCLLSRKKDKDIENISMGGDFEFTCTSGNESLESDLISRHPICQISKELYEEQIEEEIVIGYYELFVLDGGSNDTVEIGIISNTHKCYLLNCSNGFIHISDDENDKIVIYKELPGYSNTYLGVGVTNTNKLFYTYNNMIIRPFLDLNNSLFSKTEETTTEEDEDDEDNNFDKPVQLFAFLRVGGNEFFSGMVNFGQNPFHFNFANEQEKIVNIKPLEELEKNNNLRMNDMLVNLQLLRKKEPDYEFTEMDEIILLSAQTLKRIVNTKDPFIYDEKVINYYEKEENSLEKIFSKYPPLKFSFTKKKKKDVQDIVYNFNKARNLKRLANFMISKSEEEEIEGEGEIQQKAKEEKAKTTGGVLKKERELMMKNSEEKKQPEISIPPGNLKFKQQEKEKLVMPALAIPILERIRKKKRSQSQFVRNRNINFSRHMSLDAEAKEELEIKLELEKLKNSQRPRLLVRKPVRPNIKFMTKKKIRKRVAIQSLPIGFTKNGLEKKIAFQHLLQRKADWRKSIYSGELNKPKRSAPTLPTVPTEHKESTAPNISQESKNEENSGIIENPKQSDNISLESQKRLSLEVRKKNWKVSISKGKLKPKRKAPTIHPIEPEVPVDAPVITNEETKIVEKPKVKINPPMIENRRSVKSLPSKAKPIVSSSSIHNKSRPIKKPSQPPPRKPPTRRPIQSIKERLERFKKEKEANKGLKPPPNIIPKRPEKKYEINKKLKGTKPLEIQKKKEVVEIEEELLEEDLLEEDLLEEDPLSEIPEIPEMEAIEEEPLEEEEPTILDLKKYRPRNPVASYPTRRIPPKFNLKKPSAPSSKIAVKTPVSRLLLSQKQERVDRRQSLPVGKKAPPPIPEKSSEVKAGNRKSLNLHSIRKPAPPGRRSKSFIKNVPVLRGRDRRASSTMDKKKIMMRRKIVSTPPPVPGKKGRPVISIIQQNLFERMTVKRPKAKVIQEEFGSFHFE